LTPAPTSRVGEPLAVEAWVDSVAYSPDGETLAVGGNGFVRLLDVRTRKPLAAAGVRGQAARVAFTSDGSRLVLMTESASIQIRDGNTLELRGSFTPPGFRPTFIQSYYRPPHFAFASDGRSVLTASESGELAWWDLQTQRPIRTLEIAPGYHALALSPDGRTAALGIDGGIQLVDVATGDTRRARAGPGGGPLWLAFSPDGKSVASANDDGAVTLWDVVSATPRETLRGHSHAVEQLVFSADGNALYTVSFDGNVVACAPLLNTGGEVTALAFARDGRTLAAATRFGRVTIWNLATRSLRHDSITAAGFRLGLEFTPDGTLVADSGGGVELWDVGTGRSLGRIGLTSASDDSLSADGRLVAFARGGGSASFAEVWRIAERSLVADLAADDDGSALTVALSPDGRLLALGGYAKLVSLWQVHTGKLVHELDVGGAEDLEFSPDGRIVVASSGASGLSVARAAVSLWDVATGTQIGPSLTAGSRALMIDVSPDGRRLLMTAADGEGAVWDIDPKSWARRACALANRTLTHEEWERFLPGRAYEPACMG
jgi:WD40 repeat protein